MGWKQRDRFLDADLRMLFDTRGHMPKVIIVGAHGKVALLTVPRREPVTDEISEVIAD